MEKVIKTAIKNVLTILALDLILLPFGVFLYLVSGFHIFHLIVALGYIYGLILVYDTSALLYNNVRIVSIKDYSELNQVENDQIKLEEESDFCCQKNFDGEDCECNSEELKPEMKKAIDEVFGLQK